MSGTSRSVYRDTVLRARPGDSLAVVLAGAEVRFYEPATDGGGLVPLGLTLYPDADSLIPLVAPLVTGPLGEIEVWSDVLVGARARLRLSYGGQVLADEVVDFEPPPGAFATPGDVAVAVSDGVVVHEAAADPHPVYLTAARGDLRYLPVGTPIPPAVDAYTKTQSDARYEPLDSAYTKSESDLRYLPVGYTPPPPNLSGYLPLTGGTMTGLLRSEGLSGAVAWETAPGSGGTDDAVFHIRGDGRLEWCAGDNSWETYLYRPDVNLLSLEADFQPDSNNWWELGKSARRWKKLWAQNADLSGTLAATGAVTFGGALTVSGPLTLPLGHQVSAARFLVNTAGGGSSNYMIDQATGHFGIGIENVDYFLEIDSAGNLISRHKPVVVSPTAGNTLTWDATGLYAAAAAADVTVTADASLTATESPANTFALAARLSPDADNVLTLRGNGLAVPAAPQVTTGDFHFQTNPAMTDPGTGNFRSNTGVASTATALALDQIGSGGSDISTLFAALRLGDTIYVQDKNDATKWTRYQLTAVPTVNSGWAQIPVTVIAFGGAIAGSQLCVMQMTMTSGGGGGGVGLASDALADAKGDVFAASGNNAIGRLALGTDGQVLTADSAQPLGVKWAPLPAVPVALTDAWVSFVIDGGGAAITTGQKGHFVVPGGTILEARLLADQTGSVVIDLWKDTYTNAPPAVADSICPTAKPTLASALKSQNTSLTGWATTLADGDILAVNVDSAATVQRVSLALKIRKT